VSCATSFALANAAEYGGDPDTLTLSGISSEHRDEVSRPELRIV
jgi:hypothetical protein